MNYRAFGLNIHSNIHFSENFDSNNASDISIQLGKIDYSKYKDLVNEDIFWIKGDLSKDLILHWKDIGTFRVYNGHKIIVSPEKGVKPHDLDHYLKNAVFAALLNQRGFLVLHASAVQINGNAIAFIAPPGMGKSTIALALNRAGYPLLTDDILAIQINENDKPTALPGFSQIRLSPQFISSILDQNNINHNFDIKSDFKGIYFPKIFSNNPAPLKSIYIIDRDTNFDIKLLKGHEALMGLLNNSYCSVMFPEKEKILNLSQCAELLKKINVSSLKFKSSLSMIPKLVKMVEEDVFNDI